MHLQQRAKASAATELGARIRSLRPYWPLALAAVAVIILPILLRPVVRPYYGAANFDPAYRYLLNALNILTGMSPGHTDHPGTTLQTLGAGVVGATWLLSRIFGATKLPLVDAVLIDPEHYLRSINFVLTVAIAAALLVFSCRLRDAAGGTRWGLLAQCSLLASPSVLIALQAVTPETLLIATMLVAATVVIPAAFDGQEQRSGRRAAVTGAILGFVLATKLTAVPWLLLVFLFRGWKRWTLAVACAGSAFLICTAPIWPQYPQMILWWWDLAIHSGDYGSGEVSYRSGSHGTCCGTPAAQRAGAAIDAAGAERDRVNDPALAR